jgi:oligopeptide transport system substrate-binding protein
MIGGISMLKKVLAIALSVIIVASVLGACGQKSTNNASTKDTIKFVAGEEPKTLDPGTNNSLDGGIYILHAFEGLTKVGKDGKTTAGMAKSWDISSDGTKYTFHLRDGITWSDGKPVTAGDFEYAWKRALDPAVASEYAYQLYYLKNGEEYNMSADPTYKGTKATAADVGVKATDDKTLEVTLKAPASYFLDLTNFPTYMPIRKDIVEKYKDKWTQSPDSYISNGPFKMSKWEHNSQIVFVKNDKYWDKDNITLKEIDWTLMSEQDAALNAFQSGEIDASYDLVPPEELKNLQSQGKLKILDKLGTYYLDLNIKKAPLDNIKVRKALNLAIDRQQIVDVVTKAGEKPAVGFVPFGVPGATAGKDFRSEISNNTFFPASADVTQAKKLLSEAGYPDGKGFPELEILYNNTGNHKQIMEAVQEQWRKNLGISVKISGMEWKVLQSTRHEKNYTVSRDGWIGDYNDPMTFMDMWTSNSGNNNTNFANAQYDSLIRQAQSTMDQKVRMDAMHKAEKILLEEQPIVPIYFYTTRLLIDPKWKNVQANPLGFIYLYYATYQG